MGFPVMFAQGGMNNQAVRFSLLMQKLAQNNNGAFVGLNSLR
jgi:hypothetical protein